MMISMDFRLKQMILTSTPIRSLKQIENNTFWEERVFQSEKLRSFLSPHRMEKKQQNYGPLSARQLMSHEGNKQHPHFSITEFLVDQKISHKPEFQIENQQEKRQFLHKRSMTDSLNKTKFYCFSKLKQDKCRQQQVDSTRVIRSTKKIDFNTNQGSEIKNGKSSNERKRIIQHLDDIMTVESKQSPRQSISSSAVLQIQQSFILMRGCDLILNLDNHNSFQDKKCKEIATEKSKRMSRFFQSRTKTLNDQQNQKLKTELAGKQVNQGKVFPNQDFFQRRKLKGLMESNDWINREKSPADLKSFFKNNKISKSIVFTKDDDLTIKTINESEISSQKNHLCCQNAQNLQRNKTNTFFNYMSPSLNKNDSLRIQKNNSLSFLKVKRSPNPKSMTNIC